MLGFEDFDCVVTPHMTILSFDVICSVANCGYTSAILERRLVEQMVMMLNGLGVSKIVGVAIYYGRGHWFESLVGLIEGP